jgi:hypothetical protein
VPDRRHEQHEGRLLDRRREGTLGAPTTTITTNIPSGTGQATMPGQLVNASAGTTPKYLVLFWALSGMDRFS